MSKSPQPNREQAQQIWQSAVDAVRPEALLQGIFANSASDLNQAVADAKRVIVVGTGKAGSAMASVVEEQLAARSVNFTGVVNVPGGTETNGTRRIRCHAARPPGSNQPTAEGVAGAEQILNLVASAGPDDVVLCLVSGGGSALLPAPVEGVSLDDKQKITLMMHKCGATINEMNAVRKHLSRVKGGRLAQAFRGRALYSLIISDVIGDPLDVIASGPTSPDSSTFQDAWNVLEKYDLSDDAPKSVVNHLRDGVDGKINDTPKALPKNVHNLILGNNVKALQAAAAKATELGWSVLNLGSYIEGETKDVAIVLAGLIRSIRRDGAPCKPPVCILSGGETTVSLGTDHGRGGRNQEMALAIVCHLGERGMDNVVALCGGTDGEDGPTNAAGAFADVQMLRNAAKRNQHPKEYLRRHDAWTLFNETGDLLVTGLTETNVMDVRVILVGGDR